MAWDSAWWLEPSPQSNHAGAISSGFAQGFARAQQHQEMALQMKQLAMQQQYRIDSLAIANRQADARIADYERRKQEALNEQDDMLAISRAMPELRAGIEIPLTLKSEAGVRALSGLRNSFSLEKSREKLTAADTKARGMFESKLASLADYAPEVFHGATEEYKRSGVITPELANIVNSTYEREVFPHLAQPPPGMKAIAIRKNFPGGEYGIFREPKPEEQPRYTGAANLSKEIAILKGKIAKFQAGPDPLLSKEEQEIQLKGTKAQLDALEKEQAAARTGEPAKEPNPLVPSIDERVRVQSPDGKTGTVPRSQLQQALSQGFKQL